MLVHTCTDNSLVENIHRKNPLGVDPTRTITLRKQFIREFNRHFNWLKSQIILLVESEDAFGLKRRSRQPSFNEKGVLNQRFAFASSAEQVQAFERWLEEQIDTGVIVTPNSPADGYWRKYVDRAYKKGAGRAFDDVRKPYARGLAATGEVSDFFEGTKFEFLQSTFGQPVSIEKVKLLAGRVFTDLKGVTTAMSTQMSRTLVDGLAQGSNPRKIARELNRTIEQIGKKRAKMIAQTEVIRAHAEGQLDALEAMPIKTVTVMSEWATAGDERVCPLCADLEGLVLKTSEARGLLPRHPNCRCAWLPANIGEEFPKGSRRADRLQAQLDKSLGEELPTGRVIKGEGRRFLDPNTRQFTLKKKRTLEEQRALSNWPGARLKIPSTRPKQFRITKKELEAVRKKSGR